jgi:hypothetical protein
MHPPPLHSLPFFLLDLIIIITVLLPPTLEVFYTTTDFAVELHIRGLLLADDDRTHEVEMQCGNDLVLRRLVEVVLDVLEYYVDHILVVVEVAKPIRMEFQRTRTLPTRQRWTNLQVLEHGFTATTVEDEGVYLTCMGSLALYLLLGLYLLL